MEINMEILKGLPVANAINEKLIEEVLRLKNHPDQLAAMSRASRACAPDRALDIIYDTIRKDL